MAKNHEDILDNDNVEEKEEKHDEPVTESSDGGATSEHPRQIIYVMEESGNVANDDQDNVIEQIDGNAESETIASYDLTISALDADDAYLNIEENLLTMENSPRIPFISNVASKEVKDKNSEDYTLYTLEVQIENEKNFLAKVENIFHNWDPSWYGNISLVVSSGS